MGQQKTAFTVSMGLFLGNVPPSAPPCVSTLLFLTFLCNLSSWALAHLPSKCPEILRRPELSAQPSSRWFCSFLGLCASTLPASPGIETEDS